jgi:hypothetical protein
LRDEYLTTRVKNQFLIGYPHVAVTLRHVGEHPQHLLVRRERCLEA